MQSPEELASCVGDLIKAKRTELGLSREQLAVRAGLDRSSISLYESNKRVPTITSAARVAKALEIKLSEQIRQAEDG
ncbi:MAG: helix-turn-helix transcriptional regulator [Verrucomicrobia bacterium]|nr:helix-turn-helix transcriptional regulator [Verrucomicrobiota bacterium]MCH8514238.1 helix-turn-helix domain-containing protein [Kiritimatiellia bacterium]